MPINQELLTRIEESADDWGPQGTMGNDPAHVRHVEESKKVDEVLGLHPISIRFPKELVRDLKAIAQLNGMGYQPLIREVCRRFVEAEKKAILRDIAVRRQEEAKRLHELEQEAQRVTQRTAELSSAEHTTEDNGDRPPELKAA